MTLPDGFDATFTLRIDRATAWQRLIGETLPGAHVWLPGFDSKTTVVDVTPGVRLSCTKDDEPCAGTDIVVTLEDAETGTLITVVQSRFGDFLDAAREAMAIGWRFIVADLQTYLATGVHAQRHLRRWGDFGADATCVDGGLLVRRVREGGMASDIGLAAGDLLVELAEAPVASLEDLVTIMRVVAPDARPTARWIREGALLGS